MNARRFKRGTIPAKLGKRTRRALVRMRHLYHKGGFIRWGLRTNNLPPAGVPFWRCPEWHTWHLQGRP